MTEYQIVYLMPGQIPPEGSTGIALSNGGIMWVGEDGTFPNSALLGNHLESDPVFEIDYDHILATQADIDEYNTAIGS